jgi:hypothetical protein
MGKARNDVVAKVTASFSRGVPILSPRQQRIGSQTVDRRHPLTALGNGPMRLGQRQVGRDPAELRRSEEGIYGGRPLPRNGVCRFRRLRFRGECGRVDSNAVNRI